MSPPPVDRGTCGAPLARGMMALAIAKGLEPARVLGLMQTDLDMLADPDARFPAAAIFAFWEHVVRELDDPSLPIQLAEAIRIEDLGVVGFAVMTAATVREAVERAIRYHALLATTARLVLEEGAEGTRLALLRDGERTLGMRLMNETSIACSLRSSRLLTGIDVIPFEVAFRHAGPRDTAAHERFFRAPIGWGAHWDGLVFPSELLSRVPDTANHKMSEFFQRYAEDLLRRLQSGESLADRVRAAISQELPRGEPSMGAVARRVGASERTLRRLLSEERTSFSNLVESVRRETARELLRESKASITEIAYLLGFSETSAFSRAFRRWYGEAPREYRQQCS